MNPLLLAAIVTGTWAAVLAPVFAWRVLRPGTGAAAPAPGRVPAEPADLPAFTAAAQPYEAGPVTVEEGQP